MSVLITIFMIVAAIFAFATLGYVAVDVVLEKKNANKAAAPAQVAPVVVAAPVVKEPEPEVMPAVVESIGAEEADSMISDDLAMKSANYEKGAGHGQQGIINIGVLGENFGANDVVTLAALKAKGLVPKKIGRIKVLANGILSKPLTIKAESYSIQAIKMIELTGGKVIILKD